MEGKEMDVEAFRDGRTRKYPSRVTEGQDEIHCKGWGLSMDGDLAKLPEICYLAERYQALVIIDDSHAAGFVGDTGRGSRECGHVGKRIDVITSTLGKALGGGLGGFTNGKKGIIERSQQGSRPYLSPMHWLR
jgi:seryl-tRNA(Sec) selenium transferase